MGGKGLYFACFSLLAVLSSCGGGGGGSGGTAGHGVLLSIEFPDPAQQNSAYPPNNASLVQQIVFKFDVSPRPSEVSSATLPILDINGFQAPGTYRAQSSVVTFTPDLPVRPLNPAVVPPDLGGAGLVPASLYTIKTGARLWDFITGISAGLLKSFADPNDPLGVALTMTTTGNPAQYFTGLEPEAPRLIAVDPEDGSSGISPNLFSDPDDLFPPAQIYTFAFSRSVNPELTNVSDALFRLVDLDERTSDFPSGLLLGTNVRILRNEVDRSVIEVEPSGILPFGHLLALEYPTDLNSLSQGTTSGSGFAIASSFSIAGLPPGQEDGVRDRIVEVFDDDDRKADDSLIGLGRVPAHWDRDDSNVLVAAQAFEGSGELGRFIPSPPPAGETRTIVLDTSVEVFPLFDGSTPDAPAGKVVNGGVFNFTDIDIPAGILLIPQGPNPLILLATGTVRLAGEIRVDGFAGTSDGSFDSAISSTPGGNPGPGGGRGAISHPILYFPSNVISPLTLIDPFRGGVGFGPGNIANVGGQGGEVGVLDNVPIATDQEMEALACIEYINGEHENGGKVPGGGGGSFLFLGTPGINGKGNVRPDGQGGYIIPKASDPTILFAGGAGPSPFGDSDTKNNFIGISGELKVVIGGQGGGGGGSRLESYFCGAWCKFDADSRNEFLCLGGEFPVGSPGNQIFAASVGDAKGGGGGGGGGAVQVRALGGIVVEGTAKILARGGAGGGGETLGCSNWGGGGGGGSGGAILLESGDRIDVKVGSVLDVSNGRGARAHPIDERLTGCNPGGGNPGQGGDGSPGIVQLQVPFGTLANVEDKGSIVPKRSWVDQKNERNPAAFTPFSVAQSVWYDVGRMIARTENGASPVFRFKVAGIFVDPGDDGLVDVDAEGYVVEPDQTDIVCDYLGLRDSLTGDYLEGEEPRSDFIPRNASVRVEFQGGDAIAEGSKEVNPDSETAWSPSPSIADGKQFIRYRITFDITADDSALRPMMPLPAVQEIIVDAEYGGS